MLEVSIRVFSCAGKSALYPDYHEYLKLVQRDLGREVKAYMRETEDTEIHQYYSLSPFYYLEIRFLKRMRAGSSVMCVSESAEDYAEGFPLPRIFQKWIYRYVRRFLNSLDFIVVSDIRVEDKLRTEGVNLPVFYTIPEKEAEGQMAKSRLWLELYRKMENRCRV